MPRQPSRVFQKRKYVWAGYSKQLLQYRLCKSTSELNEAQPSSSYRPRPTESNKQPRGSSYNKKVDSCLSDYELYEVKNNTNDCDDILNLHNLKNYSQESHFVKCLKVPFLLSRATG